MYWDDGSAYHFLYTYYEADSLSAQSSDEIYFLDTVPPVIQDGVGDGEVSSPGCTPVLPVVVSHGQQNNPGTGGLVSLGIGFGGFSSGGYLFRARRDALPSVRPEFKSYSCSDSDEDLSGYCYNTCGALLPRLRAGSLCTTSFPVNPGVLTCRTDGSLLTSAWTKVSCVTN